jgi:hypothetical protein
VVHPPDYPRSSPQHLSAPASVSQKVTRSVLVSGNGFLIDGAVHLLSYPGSSERPRKHPISRDVLVPSDGVSH